MTDKKLFDKLIEENIISQETANSVLKGASFSGKSAEEILYEEEKIDEKEVAKVKSALTGVPFKEVDAGAIPDEVIDMVSYETSKTYKVIPIEKKEDMLVVGMLDPEDEQAQNALRFIAKQARLSLGAYIVTPAALKGVWRRYMPYQSVIQAAIKELGEVDKKEKAVELEKAFESAEEAPIIKIVASTLKQAVDLLASDIHIEPQRNRLRIRFRIDGELQEMTSLPVGLGHPIVSRVKVLSRLRLDETRIPQDGRFRSVIFGRDIDFRVATFPTPSGEKVAIRVLDPTAGMKSLEELGLGDYNYKILSEAIESPYGMILITGPTGSGKTTTLYAMMNKLNLDDVNIVSLEDPVEYFIAGVNQSQVLPEIGYSFASGLRQVLRQDPDIIMVGEIRDKETSSLAVNASLTGHLMLSTLHTNNAVGVVPRLVDLGVPGFLLSSALNTMLAQRLVSKLHSECREAEEAPPDIQEIIKEEVEKMPEELKERINKKYKAPYKIFKPKPKKDCEICKGKGTSGRMAIFEIFRMTDELSSLISSGFNEEQLWKEARRQGMITLRQDGIIKALEGKILMEEILRETHGN